MIEKRIQEMFSKVFEKIEKISFLPLVEEEGEVISVGDDIAYVKGLPGACLFELLVFEKEDIGLIFDLDVDKIGVVLLQKRAGLRSGDKVYRTGKTLSVAVGPFLLGQVLDGLGTPLSKEKFSKIEGFYPVEKEAPSLIERDFVREPLYTGITVIDALIPIGKGQRELILGDPATGKTALAIDTIINQKKSDVISIYVSIGQKKEHINRIYHFIANYGDLSKTILLKVEGGEPLGLQYIAPYAATAIAEYFRDQGKSVLIIYDDLTKHASSYRSLSLLLKRPPGREAFPGDIFYLHSRLLERAGKLTDNLGGGSITALPIVETQQGNISAFIPTNLISITDGQIYLDAELFHKGIRPAIDVGKSVSRIGGKAQVPIMKELAGRLKIEYSQFLEREIFTKFGMKLEEETQKLIKRGQRYREIFKQKPLKPRFLEEHVLFLMLVESGLLDEVELESIKKVSEEIINKTKIRQPGLIERINKRGNLTSEEKNILKDTFKEIFSQYYANQRD
ncbi:MAG: F0F1 ATP synthase subunit alpha [Caldimicrobium sp.]